jgi:hypothetical protein
VLEKLMLQSQKKAKLNKQALVGGRQKFDLEGAKFSALAVFDIALNEYQRGADNKWRKSPKPSHLPKKIARDPNRP